MFERKLTHLLRCCKILKSSCTIVHSGFRIPCALHMGNFSPKHRVLVQAQINFNLNVIWNRFKTMTKVSRLI
jgi:hypothetical protein